MENASAERKVLGGRVFFCGAGAKGRPCTGVRGRPGSGAQGAPQCGVGGFDLYFRVSRGYAARRVRRGRMSERGRCVLKSKDVIAGGAQGAPP